MANFLVRLWGWDDDSNDSVVLEITLPFSPSSGLMFANQFADAATVKITSCSYDVKENSFDCDVDFVDPLDREMILGLNKSELVRHGWKKPSP